MARPERSSMEKAQPKKQKWENLVGKGKISSVMKEIERGDEPNQLSLEKICALHNDTDRKELAAKTMMNPRQVLRDEEELEIKNALRGLNSSSTPSLDGLTVEFIKRCCSGDRNLRGHLVGAVALSLFAFYLTNTMEEAEKGGARVWGYLDDLIVISRSKETLSQSLNNLTTSLTKIGLSLNPTKTVLLA
ncbi:hypothetical protein BLNAU_2537 [Blattamonas nauphoetae]|uniref:Reverse transcriptase domain-containing protein n=1 Tax=Blattamonas nauphoetae TaxID=2049346 RepID=A0ABQ9YET7_9EUKA|nr:hypothetical protein BLNAU_2537 [Blattamonas nauphoetae]